MFPGEINILKSLESIRNPFLNTLFDIITMLGEEFILIALLAILYFAINKVLAKKLFFITVTSMNINGVVKCFARVPRPFANGEITCLKPDTATGYSFPSGHTQTFSTWSTALAFHFKKWWMFLVAGILIFLVGLSRMYLGAHYLSDVLFGGLLGISFAFGLSIIYDKVNNKFILFGIATAIILPFVIYFTIVGNQYYADTFKTFGMMLGLFACDLFESKYGDFDMKAPWWKKLIRIVVAIILAVGIKELLKLTYKDCEIDSFVLIMNAVRYFVVVVMCFGVWPILIKKLNL